MYNLHCKLDKYLPFCRYVWVDGWHLSSQLDPIILGFNTRVLKCVSSHVVRSLIKTNILMGPSLQIYQSLDPEAPRGSHLIFLLYFHAHGLTATTTQPTQTFSPKINSILIHQTSFNIKPSCTSTG